jgi:hypothetical protein
MRIIDGMIASASELINELGGTGEVAGALGVKDNTVSTWRERGFPAWACERLRALAVVKGKQADPQLFEIKSRVRSAA